MKEEEGEELSEVELLLGVAELIVSIFSHVARLDNVVDETDEDLAGGLIDSFFGEDDSLFPNGLLLPEDEESITDILMDAYEDPYSMEDIIELCKENDDLGEFMLHTLEDIFEERLKKGNKEFEFYEDFKVRIQQKVK